MSTSTVHSVNLLPTYLQTNKNSKFLSSTIDQLIQPAQLERLNAYIGSTSTPTYHIGDSYVQESTALRQAYQLDPALVTNDINGVIQSVVALDDLANEIALEGGLTNNFDRLFRSQVYPYYPQIAIDKLVNYEKYYWLPEGPELVNIDQADLDVANQVIGQSDVVLTVGNNSVQLLNGMMVTFSGDGVSNQYKYKEFFVEGTGTSIVLVPYDSLITPEVSAQQNPDLFDKAGFDMLSFDDNRNIPVDPQYITINRASKDLNAWSRANRWVHEDIIIASTAANNAEVKLPPLQRALRPIIEFNADIKLFNHGSVAYKYVDVVDKYTKNAFLTISGTTIPGTSNTSTVVVDGIPLEHGYRIIFTNDTDPTVQNNIYQVNFVNINGTYKLVLLPASDNMPEEGASVIVTQGTVFGGTTLWYNGTTWVSAQQKTATNQAPLFDLFDENEVSYSDTQYYLSNFTGNKIFGYKINNSNPVDSILGLHVDYRNISSIGSFLFTNYFGTDQITVSLSGTTVDVVPTSKTFFKIGNKYLNVWDSLLSPPININSTGYYDVPLSLTNNPLNSYLTDFTLADFDQQAVTNTRLISNGNNPMAFAMMFIGKKSNSVIDAIEKSSDAYNQFKLALIAQASSIADVTDPVKVLDEILTKINLSKTSLSPYYLSDMVAYGVDKKTLTYTVTNPNVVTYSINSEFNLTASSNRSVLIYLNGRQLTAGQDYTFDPYDAGVTFSIVLSAGDVITINDYRDTRGSFIPPTPTKLGLYPSFVPKIYSDNTYASGPVNVIQGHDGSIMLAYNDYRDAIILEYELRVFNNLKVAYRPELFDVNSSNPGAFRDSLGTSNYSLDEVNKIIQPSFIKWAGTYGIEYITNNSFDINNPFTWNYTGSVYKGLQYPNASAGTGISVSGSWRAVFEYFYDTDRPHTAPWEMLGFGKQPSWWDAEYGVAPYTSGNTKMWTDIQAGNIAQGPTAGINTFYARPGLLDILPVDEFGNLLSPTIIGLVAHAASPNISYNWNIGNRSPAETAWRRSSYWPFVVQRLLALTQPATYCALMYDPANMSVNKAGQWTYGSAYSFLQLPSMPIHGESGVATSGYGVFVSEVGQQRTQNYINELRQDLKYVNFNLFYKVGGFVNPNTLQIIIDAYEPTTTAPGAILPNESYSLILNTSNPIQSIGISGIIVQRTDAGYVVRGYDRQQPYFTYYPAVRNANTPTITVGGVTSDYVAWTSATGVGDRNLTSLDTTTAKAAPSNIFYQAGQIVQYGNNFYRVLVGHSAESTFDASLYQILPSIPTTGGATVQVANSFNKNSVKVPYGTTFTNIQDVYDLIIGYGAWLTDQGFVFEQFNTNLGTNVDWHLSGKEFLYWSTQSWTSSGVITLSPFADQLTFQTTNSVVNNIFDNFYEYSISKADGTPFPQNNLFVARQSGQFTINVINSVEGIYFARLLCIQKEHAIVFDNTDIFGDIIYDIETGERQARMKLVGFRTANWNGDFFAPGFLYDEAKVVEWKPFTNYLASDVVKYNSQYYSAISNVAGTKSFVYTQWNILSSKPTAGLFSNFDYKVSQFNDFYSLDIDNFDSSIQQAAQNLTGYTPRPYLNNIFSDPISQYKFYQGMIREKGTANPIIKLAAATIQNLNSKIEFNEEWAFRVGQYGSFTTYNEFEVPLKEGTFVENPQIISFVESVPKESNSVIYYATPNELTIGTGTLPTVATSTSTATLQLLHAGYVRFDDVDATAYNFSSLLDIANNDVINDGTTVWLGFKPDGSWDVLRYTFRSADIIDVNATQPFSQITFTTSGTHSLSVGQLVSVVNFNSEVNGVYTILEIPSNTEFTVASTLGSIDFNNPSSPGMLFTFDSIRVETFDNLPIDQTLYRYNLGSKVWVNTGNGTDNNGWAVYEKVLNYTNTDVKSISSISNEGLGYSISKPKGSKILAVGSPYYTGTNVGGFVSGNVGLYEINNNKLQAISFYQMYNTAGTGNLYGYSVAYNPIPFSSSTYGLIFAGAPGANNNAGKVLVTGLDTYIQTKLLATITTSTSGSAFGSSLSVVPTSTITSLLFVGAPVGNGAVHSYTVKSTATVSSVYSGSVSGTSGSLFGTSIATNSTGSLVAIGAPGYSQATGQVRYYTGSLSSLGTITSPFATGTNFGQSLAMSRDGYYLAVSAPNLNNDDGSIGAVCIYTLTNNAYVLDTTLINPVIGSTMNFGIAMDFTSEADALVVTALGTNTSVVTYFDEHTTTFDLDTTRFTESEIMSGSAYLYSRRGTRFVYSEELVNAEENITTGTNYGTSVSLDNGVVLVGAPGGSTQLVSTATSAIYQFTAIDPAVVGWNQLRVQDDFVLPSGVQKICLVDTVSNDIINYYDYVDPLKGQIVGLAEEELTYKVASDPAIYSIGDSKVNVNNVSNWLDNQVGQLWWDLSTAKFTWYEQGDLEYRRINWNTLFPGASIDVYEWVKSTLLPSDWAIQADTTSGLAKGISGQPKYPDNSTLSVTQEYDSATGGFINTYYYWVKNKATIPNVADRRTSAQNVASYIANPLAAGLQFASIIDKNTIMLANIATELKSDQISLNFAIDNTNSKIPRHTEWQLMTDGKETSTPPGLLERKMIDSFIGYSTSTGALVPDPKLSARAKFGIGIRPQQTLFNNRFEALRNVIDFANSILIDVQVTSNYSFNNLNAAEPFPTQYTVIEDATELDPVFVGSTSTVTVLVDADSNNGWAVYELQNSKWVRVRTQSYNTPLYWKHVDWVSTSYDAYRDITVAVDELYQLAEVSLSAGQYVKVNNRGDGNYIILEVAPAGTVGDFGNNYLTRYIQNGTIQFLDTLWNLAFGWNQTYSYSQTLFDQTPNKEIQFILTALKDDLFINDLRVNWNKLFFKAMKYAVSEQPAIDWILKTSFIDVTNYAGQLTQPPIYKLQDSSYYEDFINEVKPYHTKVRNFTTNFSNTEFSQTLTTDFDFPAYWSTLTNKFVTTPVSTSSLVYPQYLSNSGTYTTSTVPTLESLFVNPVRQITETMVFDRISTRNQIGSLSVTDIFIGDGASTEFVLSWVAQADRFKMNLSVTGEYVLPTEYTVRYYKETYNGFTKHYSKLVFLNIDQAPALGAVVTFTYEKSVSLMSAVERIQNFYAPTAGMAGTATEQLMVGVDDPRTHIGGQYEGKSFVNPYGNIVGGPDSLINPSHLSGTYDINLSQPYPTWSGTNLINALGVDPADLIIEGEYGFVTTSSAYAPEEVIPGVVADTLGIDVYTQAGYVTPTIVNGSGNVIAGTSCTFPLSSLPTTIGSIVVAVNGTEFAYSTVTNISNTFNIDWINSALVIPPQPTDGVVAYTIIGVGSNSSAIPGIIDRVTVNTVANTTTAQAVSLGSFDEVTGVFVTLDGQILSSNIIPSPYYQLVPASTTSNRASVIVYNLPLGIENTLQAWFFDNVGTNFNQVNVNYITVNGQAIFDPNQPTFAGIDIPNPPGNVGPPSSQVIVEASDIGSNTSIRLLPPSVTYYTVTSTSVTQYQIKDAFNPFVKDVNYGDNVNVYINGSQIALGADFTFDNNNVTISKSFNVGDVIAVESYMPNNFANHYNSSTSVTYDYDYIVTLQGKLVLSPNWYTRTNINYKITTYTDQDSMGIETQVFKGNPYRTYILDRPVLDQNYVWVTINYPISNTGRSGEQVLIGGVDFQVLSDQLTVVIGDAYDVTSDCTVVIMSIAGPSNKNILGYRYFRNILGQESFTRLSNKNSTYLTQPLYTTSTEIHVADSTILSPADPGTNTPGAVLISGELIEFYENSNNVLSQLRRGARGTGIITTATLGTRVIDQGVYQTVPIAPEQAYQETVLAQNTYTNAALSNTYTIKSSSITGWINTLTASVIRCDGISFLTSVSPLPVDPYTGSFVVGNRIYSVSTASIAAKDQIQVYYGGYPLRKNISYYQDTTVQHDSILESQILGTFPTVSSLTNVYSRLSTDLQYTPNPAYVTTDTSIVWVYKSGQSQVNIDYTTSTNVGLPVKSTGTTYLVTSTNLIYWSTGTGYIVTATLGLIDSGLRQLPPDFTINTSTQVITLNTSTVKLNTGTLLSIVMKRVTSSWNDVVSAGTSTVSLTSSTSFEAQFLQEAPAILPDVYFYSGNAIKGNV